MRQTFGYVLFLLAALFCVVTVILLFVGMFNQTSKTVEIGPHSSIVWEDGESLSADGLILLNSSNGVTVTQKDGLYVTATTPGEIPAGEKLPVFTSKFYAKPSTTYSVSDSVTIYSDNQLSVILKWYPVNENLGKILLTFLVSSLAMWLIEKLFDLRY